MVADIDYTGPLTAGLLHALPLFDQLLILVPVFILGAAIGSFLNV